MMKKEGEGGYVDGKDGTTAQGLTTIYHASWVIHVPHFSSEGHGKKRHEIHLGLLYPA